MFVLYYILSYIILFILKFIQYYILYHIIYVYYIILMYVLCLESNRVHMFSFEGSRGIEGILLKDMTPEDTTKRNLAQLDTQECLATSC